MVQLPILIILIIDTQVPHGLGSSGTVTASVSGSGYAGGTHGGIINTSWRFYWFSDYKQWNTIYKISSVDRTWRVFRNFIWSTVSNRGCIPMTFNGGNDLEIVVGGMSGNNQVILKGEVTVVDGPYSFHGNTTSSQVSTIFFTGSTSHQEQCLVTGFKLNTTSGVFTEG